MDLEGRDGPFLVNYYDPIPDKVVPNDDLDLQILWYCVLSGMDKPVIDRDVLADAWLNHVHFPFSEYAVAIRNLKLGIRPPLSGACDNWFTNGMGAAIRTEIWAALAPGNPELAVKYAYEDACVDHAGEGVYAAMFLAALESLAFVATDRDELINQSLQYIPQDCELTQAINMTITAYEDGKDWLYVRKLIIDKYDTHEFTNVLMNVPFIILAWLVGGGDFGKTICTAVNCGKDTDCTAATVGAILGILDPDCIDSKWLKPIGTDIIVSPQIVGINPPKCIDEFTDGLIELGSRIEITSEDFDISLISECNNKSSLTEIPVEIAFTSWKKVFYEHADLSKPPVMTGAVEKKLSGSWVSMDKDCFADEALIVKYRIFADKDCSVRILFNTESNCRVWVDDNYCFGRECGRMAPSPHYAPINQFADIELKQGWHNIFAAIERPKTGSVDWVFTVADSKTRELMPQLIWYK